MERERQQNDSLANGYSTSTHTHCAPLLLPLLPPVADTATAGALGRCGVPFRLAAALLRPHAPVLAPAAQRTARAVSLYVAFRIVAAAPTAFLAPSHEDPTRRCRMLRPAGTAV